MANGMVREQKKVVTFTRSCKTACKYNGQSAAKPLNRGRFNEYNRERLLIKATLSNVKLSY